MAYNPDSFAHKAERKGVELLVDAAIKHTNKDRQKAMMQFIDLAQKFIGDTWDPAAYDRMRDAIATTDTKWYKYISGLFDDITPKQMKALADFRMQPPLHRLLGGRVWTYACSDV